MSRNARLYLPPEVIEIIAGYLAFEHPPTLLNFAKASKTYNTCARPAIKSIFFHDIRIPVPKGQRLKEIVNRLIKRLDEVDGFRYVRQLVIIHADDTFENTDEWEPPRLSDLRCDKPADTYATQFARWRENKLRFKIAGWRYRSLGLYSNHVHTRKNVWKPVIHLIKQLPALTDLVWRFADQFPFSILETLHRERPQCRLHLESFCLRSLHGAEITPDALAIELAIVSSPSLHTVHISGSLAGKPYHDTLLRLLELAPNLKDVRAINLFPPWFTFEEHNVRSGLAPLEVFHIEDNTDRLPVGVLDELSHYMDFSALQILNIDHRLDDEVINGAMEFSFPFLKSLSLNISGEVDMTRTAECYEILGRFLRSLSPLRELKLKGWHTLVHIMSLVSRHGPRLRKLKLLEPIRCQWLNEEEIRCIGKECPFLEELTITIKRTQGDVVEVGLYKALGTIQNLQYLDLNYEISPAGLHNHHRETMIASNYCELSALSTINELPKDPSFDEFDNQLCESETDGILQLRNGHVRRMIIDSVMDEKLVCAIFQAISGAKPPGSPLFKDLTIVSRASSRYDGIIGIVHTFNSSWRVQRDPRYIHRKKVVAEELEPYNHRRRCRYHHLPPWLEIIFYRLYPAAKPKGQPRKYSKKLAAKREKEKNESTETWGRHLHSFPLIFDGDSQQ
ncbi:hypothetical protein N7475_007060 [Penicillium sp. IBT 31633x]|nr:hypothetical protein N7475_007060 [Penicillium sp. IBT 31633x]